MSHYQLIRANKQKSLFIMVTFIIFIVAVAYFMALGFGFGLDFVGIALIISGLISFASYWFSDKIILTMSNAKKATKNEFFDYYTVTENLTMSQRMPMPKLYVIEDDAINAFATGRDPKRGVVCATTGLLKRLDRSEIEGVVAHELSHIQNYDIRLMSIVTILIGFVALLSDWMLRMTFFGRVNRNSENRSGGQLQIILFVLGLILALLSPVVAKMIQLAISRRREFLADASASGMTKNPEGLARALEKISQDSAPLKVANKATAHLFISNPLANHSKDSVSWFSKLFMTHPPIQERVRALRG
jgi:heat shock protein HtpX